jgi:23S rRNA pseudouridine1911/1915/1917 synthase
LISEDRILYIDNHLLALNKLPGELVQADRTGDTCLEEEVKAYLKLKFNKAGDVYLGVLHRIDRPVGGIVVFARTSKAAARLSKAIKDREWEKTYLAITEPWRGEEEGRLIHHLRKNAKQNKSYSVQNGTQGAKEARLYFKVLSHLDRYSLLSVQLETGRHHQIRTQLALASSPIKGDLKYGARRSNKDGSIDLLAWKLKFDHPVKKEPIELVCPIPRTWPKEVMDFI